MAYLQLDEETALHYCYHPPQESRHTFVFVNSMSASSNSWEATIAPMLTGRGFGTLSFDYRGQGITRFGARATLTPTEIVSDVGRIVEGVNPLRPVLVGLSIGGVFAMQAILQGTPAKGLVLINTLRKASPMVDWIIELEGRLLELGGMALLMDVLKPMLASPQELERRRKDHLLPGAYTPWPAEHPRHRLGAGVAEVDFDIPYEQLQLPTLVLSGAHDRLFRITADVDELTARLPSSSAVIFPDSGHALHDEHPERFVETLVEFADRQLAVDTVRT